MLYYNRERLVEKKVNIFGTGAIYKQTIPLLKADKIELLNKFDDSPSLADIKNSGCIDEFTDKMFIYCIGYRDMKNRFIRYKELSSLGVKFATYISSNSIMSHESFIGNGCIVNQGCVIDNYVKIGSCVYVNIGVTISHDSEIKDNVFVAPGVNICGYSTIEQGVFIGANATVIDNIKIGKNSIVGAGSVVIKDVPGNTLVVGNPARIIKHL